MRPIKTLLKNQKEHQLSCNVYKAFCYQFKAYIEVFTHFPAGEHRSKRTGALLKRMGLIRGVPDYILFVPTDEHPGLFIELKVEGNKPSDVQTKRMKHLKHQGYRCVVCYSEEESIDAIKKYLSSSHKKPLV